MRDKKKQEEQINQDTRYKQDIIQQIIKTNTKQKGEERNKTREIKQDKRSQ